jgi:hypothetical protein
MILDDINKKRVMHIDTSCKLYENKDTGIAYKIIGTHEHKGLVITKKIKNGLKKDINKIDLPMIYAIAIYYLIIDNLDLFDMSIN